MNAYGSRVGGRNPITRWRLAAALLLTPTLIASLGAWGTPTPQDPQPTTQGKAPSTLHPEQGCATADCHQELVAGPRVHKPVAEAKCRNCHQQVDRTKHVFSPIEDVARTCYSCHEIQLRSNVHQPLAKGNCTACHDPHKSEAVALLKTATEKALCASCHDPVDPAGVEHVHGPVGIGACSVCHDPHTSPNPSLLKRTGPDACYTCHEDMKQQLQDSHFWHRPVTEDCTLCHDPHASDHEFQLRDKATPLCLGCHKAKRAEIEAATVYHEALTTDKGCLNCHRPHGSRFDKLLDRPVVDLCRKCHDQVQKRPDGSAVAAVGKEIETAKFLHGPVAEGNCSGCHDPHGSKIFSLLRQPYPATFYTAFATDKYSLCFECHDSRAFTSEKTDTFTRFRDGDRNLHFVHVNREKKGRTCRSCHNTHASNHPLHIADSVPFGSWALPINYRRQPRGGSCAPGCHKPRSYDFGALRPVSDK